MMGGALGLLIGRLRILVDSLKTKCLVLNKYGRKTATSFCVPKIAAFILFLLFYVYVGFFLNIILLDAFAFVFKMLY